MKCHNVHSHCYSFSCVVNTPGVGRGLKLQIKTNQNEYAAHVWVEMRGCIYNEIEYAWVWCDKCQMLLFL